MLKNRLLNMNLYPNGEVKIKRQSSSDKQQS